jgi:hypothetical protein
MNTRIEDGDQKINRNPSGRKPKWKYTAARGAMKQTGKAGGINTI